MSSESLFQNFPLWKAKRIGRPPQRAELVLNFSKLEKALLSFTFDMQSGFGTRLDPTQAILINDKMVPNLDLPANKNSKSLEYVERKDIDITALLKSSANGEKNIIELNYLLSPIAVMKTSVPNSTIGSITLEIKIFYPGVIIIKEPKVQNKYCIFSGESIPKGSKVCPYCGKSLLINAVSTKQCSNKCGTVLPAEALFCENCGAEQSKEQKAIKNCVVCQKILALDAAFCDRCGNKQPTSAVIKEDKAFCVRCGSALDAGVKFCSKCGAEQPT